MTLALAVVAALGIAALYNARQRYENRLTATASLATAGANLAGAAVAEEEVLRDAAATAASLARGDPPSERLVQEQIAAVHAARTAAASGTFSTAVSGPLAEA